MRGRWALLPAALLVATLAVGLVWTVQGRGDTGWRPASPDELRRADDALHRRTLAELRGFTDWLDRNAARGYIGEVGVPGGADGDRWLLLAQDWFAAASDAGLWVDVWSVGEWWRQDYPYAPYVSAADGGPLSLTRPQGHLLSWAAGRSDQPIGVNVSGGEFGAAGGSEQETGFSNAAPGRYGVDYHYDSRATFDYLAAAGVDTVRLPFRWERIQPRLGRPLDPRELGRLRDAVARAGAAGLRVVLDVHNFGAYHLAEGERGVRRAIGSAEVGVDDFADLWRRLSAAFADDPAVAAYDLMNEPVDLPAVGDRTPAQLWEAASQAAVDAIRAGGDDTLVMVPGYAWSHVADFARQHPRAWISDPADNVRYAAHHYWAADRGRSYDADLAAAIKDGF
jgi:hypothetical protein